MISQLAMREVRLKLQRTLLVQVFNATSQCPYVGEINYVEEMPNPAVYIM